jgi:hypothetical protein
MRKTMNRSGPNHAAIQLPLRSRRLHGGGAGAAWKCAILALTLALAAGCSARKIVYLPDGRSGYITECDSKGWQQCYRRATKVCKKSSYEALERQRSPKVLYYRCSKGK